MICLNLITLGNKLLVYFSDVQMSSLKKDLNFSRRSAYAEGTVKNFKTQWESYLLFCLYFGLSYLPSNTDTLSLYAQFLSRSLKSTQSIRNYISGVKSMHYLLGYSTDNINDFLISLSLKGIARLNPYCIQQAQPITPDILIQMASCLDLSKSEDIVYWCLFLFAFFLFARKSNLVPTSKKDLKSKKFLLRNSVKFDKGLLVVTMTWSKTIQYGERKLEMPLIPISGSILCPVTAYVSMCKKVNAKSDDPLFSLPNKKYITYSKFQLKLREIVSNLHLDPQLFSSHSFRRGGATFAFQSGVPADLIQLHGDWRSDAYKKYLAFTIDDKILVSEKMRQHILKL